ncbi:hypothetical protein CR513_02973, partial [Mucuna pruriens]
MEIKILWVWLGTTERTNYLHGPRFVRIFSRVEEEAATLPILIIPDPNEPSEVCCDASYQGIKVNEYGNINLGVPSCNRLSWS